MAARGGGGGGPEVSGWSPEQGPHVQESRAGVRSKRAAAHPATTVLVGRREPGKRDGGAGALWAPARRRWPQRGGAVQPLRGPLRGRCRPRRPGLRPAESTSRSGELRPLVPARLPAPSYCPAQFPNCGLLRARSWAHAAGSVSTCVALQAPGAADAAPLFPERWGD